MSEKPDKSMEDNDLPVVQKVDNFFNDGASEGDQSMADLNRKLMPNFVVNVGGRAVKMPRLDLERVLCLYD